MIGRKACGVAVSVAAMLAATVPALAHHSFSAEFDGSKTFVVKGVLTKVDWTNPHIYLYLDVAGPGGKVQQYAFSSGPPAALRRAGIKKNDFQIGQAVPTLMACSKFHSALSRYRAIFSVSNAMLCPLGPWRPPQRLPLVTLTPEMTRRRARQAVRVRLKSRQDGRQPPSLRCPFGVWDRLAVR